MLYAVMPKDDYERACNQMREYIGDTDLIESGELKEKVTKVYDAGVAAGEEKGYSDGYSKGLSKGLEVTKDASLTADKAPEGETFYAGGEKKTGTVKIAVGGVSQLVTPAVGYNGSEECVALSYTPLEKMFIDPGQGGIVIKSEFSSFGNAERRSVEKGKTFTSAEGLLVEGTGEAIDEAYNSGAAAGEKTGFTKGYTQGAEDLKVNEARTETDITVEGATVTVPAGYYSQKVGKIVDTQPYYNEGYDKCTEDMQDDLQAKYDEGVEVGKATIKTEEARTDEDISVDGASVTVPSGYYAEAAEKTVDTQPFYNEGYSAGYDAGLAEGGEGGETTVDLTAELTEQESLISQIKAALEDKASGEGSSNFLGARMYSFGVLSDIHLGYESRGGTADFHRAIPALQNLGVEFVGIAGDVGYYSDSSSVVSELQGYKDALDTYATVPFYTLTGNHDIAHPDDVWEEYTGHPKNFEIIKDGDVFLFMSLTQSVKASSVDEPYTTSLTWLKERLSRYQGARIFIFMHYPISGYAGLRDGEYYGFSSASTEDDDLLSTLISTKNVVVFNGHTHFELECEATYDTINVFTFQHKNVSLVHVPSCAYPRDASKNEVADLSEGYVVEVYEKGVILRGVNLAVEVDEENPKAHVAEYMPDYEYALMIDNNPVVAETAAIVLSASDISLSSGESATIKVSLTDAIGTTVTISESNDYISVSPTTLTFTEGVSETKTITITAGELETSESTMITVSADGLTSKTLSVSLTYEAPAEEVIAVSAGQNLPVNGTVYGGECGASNAIYQLYDNKTAGDFNFTLRSLTLTSSQTALYFGASGSTVDITLEGTNTIDVSVASSTSQRGISSSATLGNYLTGVGENAELIIKGDPDAKTEVIKGNWVIENAKVTAAGTSISGYVLVETVTPASGGAPAGITLVRSGEFSFGTITTELEILSENLSTVQLLPCENGYLEVNLGSATAGTSAITITAYPDEGYTYTGITEAVMPASGETLTIQGVFA